LIRISGCSTDPPRDLGEDQLFIELNVDWNEWIAKIPLDPSEKTVEEDDAVKARQKKMEKEAPSRGRRQLRKQ
jgi:hypothetical protein